MSKPKASCKRIRENQLDYKLELQDTALNQRPQKTYPQSIVLFSQHEWRECNWFKIIYHDDAQLGGWRSEVGGEHLSPAGFLVEEGRVPEVFGLFWIKGIRPSLLAKSTRGGEGCGLVLVDGDSLQGGKRAFAGWVWSQ